MLARSEGHQAHFVAVPEEHLSHTASWSGEPFDALIRAEIVFFEAPNNGAVLSVGSITFCGSLLHNGGDNNISRLLANVIDRFMDPDAASSAARTLISAPMTHRALTPHSMEEQE